MVSALFMLAMVVLFAISFKSGEPTEEAMMKLEDAVRRAAVQCYALEGAYPADVEYLEAHYGLSVDHNRFKVYYSAEMSNIQPVIRVIYLPPSYVDALNKGGGMTP